MANEKHAEHQVEKIKTVKISKTIVYIGIAVIITFLLTSVYYNYYPKLQKSSQLNNYKKDLFDSLLCQYSCPLENQVYQNKSQILPSQSCVQNCTIKLKDEQAKGDKFSNTDIANDNLVKDIQDAVNSCRTSSITVSNETSGTIDNQKFFDCVKIALEGIQVKYAYLK